MPTPEAGGVPGLASASVLDALPSAIAVVDRWSLRVRFGNRAWQAQGHQSDDYLAAWTAHTGAEATLVAAVERGLSDVFAGRLNEYVVEYPMPGGERARWMLLRAAPCQLAGERLLLVAHADISERMVAERLSELQHDVLGMVVRDAPLGTTLERLAGAVVAETRGAACAVFGLNPDGDALNLHAAVDLPSAMGEAIATVPFGVFGEEIGPYFAAPLARLEPGTAVQVATELGFGLVAGVPIYAPDETLVGMLTVWFRAGYRAQTGLRTLLELAAPLAAVAIERHWNARTLRERETRLQSVFALHPDAVLTLAPTGEVITVNPATEQLFGEEASALVGDPFVRHVLPNLGARFEEHLRRALTGYPQRFATAIHPRRRSRIDLDVTFVPLMSGGSVGGVYVVAKDATEQRAAAERLELSGKQLRQSAKMEAVGRLAGGIAHDFNNLLTAIRGYTDLLLEDDHVPASTRHDLAEIARAVDRATSLTRQLLTFSRQQVVQPKLVDLNGVVEECRNMLSRLLRADTELALQPHASPVWVHADPGQIHQVIVNLIVNAQDAMPGGGRVTLETGLFTPQPGGPEPLVPLDRRRYVTLTMRDTGRGMDPETQTHVFEPFFTTKPPGQGTGLGLSTVYGIVEQSGGRIGFRSAVDRGTTFVIYLPEQPAGAVIEDRSPPSRSVARGSETILLVEDEESVRRMVQKILANAGYTVLEARHGADALVVSREYPDPIDLLLTDVVMPELNGLRLAHVLTQERPATQVIYMSGYARDEVDRKGLTEPGVTFIHKPFTVADLSAAVRSVLDRAAVGA